MTNDTAASGPATHGGACLTQYVIRGSGGFAAVSLASFSVWAFGGRWFSTTFPRGMGEPVMYAVCAAVFLGLTGLLLHSLVLGPNSLKRFYQLFVPAFLAYAVVWSAAWFALKFGLGEWLGSLGGSVVFTWLMRRGFPQAGSVGKAALMMFLLHSAGYFVGGEAMKWLNSPAGAQVFASFEKKELRTLAMLSWGLFYGLGFGAGIGYMLALFQRKGA